MGLYEDCERRWNEYRQQLASKYGAARLQMPKHQVEAGRFLAELRFLAKNTSDARFADAISAVQEHKLTDRRGRWRRGCNGFSPRNYDTESEAILAQNVEKRMQRSGDSLRAACAAVAEDCQIEAQTFAAAVKYLDRLWRQHYGHSTRKPP
jgi:hypothetical protein